MSKLDIAVLKPLESYDCSFYTNVVSTVLKFYYYCIGRVSRLEIACFVSESSCC
jgi:hypothetical protein